MAFEHYIHSGKKRLRLGYTTGCCATLAAKAATHMLLTQKEVASESILTSYGIQVTSPLLHQSITGESASCAIRKDAGDDCDATDGILVYAEVRIAGSQGGGATVGQQGGGPCGFPSALDAKGCPTEGGSSIRILGGKGIGRVTKPGLDQPVGEAAINSVPRQMIEKAVGSVCEEHGFSGCLEVEVSVPEGESIAGNTFNQNLGIEGGISILGTSGIVEPRSLDALKASIDLEIRQQAALGAERLIVVPGNYGRNYVEQECGYEDIPLVSCANFIGDTLDSCARHGFEHVMLVGHIGKMIKLAGGIMDTHSRSADCRRELFCAHAAAAGADSSVASALMQAATTDACIGILEAEGLLEEVEARLAEATRHHLERRVDGAFEIGFLVFSNEYGELYRSQAIDTAVGTGSKETGTAGTGSVVL